MAGIKHADVFMAAAGTFAYLLITIRPVGLSKGVEFFLVTILYALLLAALYKVKVLSAMKLKPKREEDGSSSSGYRLSSPTSISVTGHRSPGYLMRSGPSDSFVGPQSSPSSGGYGFQAPSFAVEDCREAPIDAKVVLMEAERPAAPAVPVAETDVLLVTPVVSPKKKRSVTFDEQPRMIGSDDLRSTAGCGDGSDDFLTTPVHKVAATNPMANVSEIEEARLVINNNLGALNAQDSMGRTPLHIAVEKGFANVCRYLLHKGAEMSIRDANGNTPIHVAAAAGDAAADIAALLLSVSPKSLVNVKNNLQETPLHAALGSGKESAVVAQRLIEAGADLTLRDAGGRPPVHVAVEKAPAKTVAALLKIVPKQDVRAKDSCGNTVLHVLAARGGDEALAKLVCTCSKAARCDFAARNKSGRTAAEEAVAAGNNTIADLIAATEKQALKSVNKAMRK